MNLNTIKNTDAQTDDSSWLAMEREYEDGARDGEYDAADGRTYHDGGDASSLDYRRGYREGWDFAKLGAA